MIGEFQRRAVAWVRLAFGSTAVHRRPERTHRFFEEAVELGQAGDMTEEDAIRLVRHVYSKPVGEVGVEAGQVMLTLATMTAAHGVDLQDAAERELVRVHQPDVLAKCRAKNAAKDPHSPLPGVVEEVGA